MFDVPPPPPLRRPHPHPPLRHPPSPLLNKPAFRIHRRRHRLLVRHDGPQLPPHTLPHSQVDSSSIHLPKRSHQCPLLLPSSTPHAPHPRPQLHHFRRRQLAN